MLSISVSEICSSEWWLKRKRHFLGGWFIDSVFRVEGIVFCGGIYDSPCPNS